MLKKRALRGYLGFWSRRARGLGGSGLARAQVRGARARRIRGPPAPRSPSPGRQRRPQRRGQGAGRERPAELREQTQRDLGECANTATFHADTYNYLT